MVFSKQISNLAVKMANRAYLLLEKN